MLKLDLIQTVAFSGVVLYAGYGLRRLIPPLARYNIPAPVIGGLLIASLILFTRNWNITLFEFDTTLQNPLMIAFFTAVGFSASFSLLRKGGMHMILLLGFASFFAIIQNIIGISLSYALGMPPLFGIIVGSVTLTGGPATGLAFAPLFEQAGVAGAASVALASAMAGIVSASWLGNPIGTFLIERFKLEPSVPAPHQKVARTESDDKAEKKAYASTLLKSIVIILVAMWIGAWVSRGFAALNIKLPAYIGAMLAAAALRNWDDATQHLGLSPRVIDELGSITLSLFIVMALMTLKLWELAGLALPMLVILVAQIIFIALLCLWPVFFSWLGKDYDAAVTSSGFLGFMLGTTANAVANMEALVERYGAAPRAFLVVPMVGAFFIDFTNALIITACLNIWN